MFVTMCHFSKCLQLLQRRQSRKKKVILLEFLFQFVVGVEVLLLTTQHLQLRCFATRQQNRLVKHKFVDLYITNRSRSLVPHCVELYRSLNVLLWCFGSSKQTAGLGC